jgi:hypothetical protein
LVVAALVAGSFFIFHSKEKLDYSTVNGFKFTKLGEKTWQTTVQMNGDLYEVPFYTHPFDIAKINYDSNVTLHIMDVINTMKPKREFVIAIHPSSGSTPVLAGVNIARITGKFYGTKTSSSLFLTSEEQEEMGNQSLPVISCDDANFLKTVIKISNNETEPVVKFIDGNKNCILVGAASDDDLLMVADDVAYKLLGIVK